MGTLMRELIEEEDEVGRFYKELTHYVPPLDRELFRFLTEIWKDEEGHSKILWKFDRWIQKLPDAYRCHPASITPKRISRHEKERSRQIMSECLKRAREQSLDERSMLEYVAVIEEIEWGDAFIDAINTVLINCIKCGAREIIPFISGIEQHRYFIERFLIARNVDYQYIKRLRRIPSLWKEKVLVVDDSETTRELLKEILSNNTVVWSAENGKEAMDILRDNYFALIISDIQMPIMDGIEFYQQVISRYPSLGKRFIFFSSDCDEYESFFKERKVPFIPKYSALRGIAETVDHILDRSRLLVQENGIL